MPPCVAEVCLLMVHSPRRNDLRERLAGDPTLQRFLKFFRKCSIESGVFPARERVGCTNHRAVS
jgi:hypothetical protein